MLPPFNSLGDLPPGIHQAALTEVEARFGRGFVRQRLIRTLRHVYALAAHTGHLERLLVFGSFVTNKDAPNDLDIVMVMAESFRLEKAPRETRVLFSHADADTRFGASVFWLRRGILTESDMAGFLEFWQGRRDGGRRGIVEVIA